jgi:hypothetical protein
MSWLWPQQLLLSFLFLWYPQEEDSTLSKLFTRVEWHLIN